MSNRFEKEQQTDVLIVGAGPAGLMMACQLANHGINFRIIDKRDRQTPYSGALLVQARTLELWDALGFAEKALQKGRIVKAIAVVKQGKQILSQSIASMGKDLSTFPFILMLKQYDTEQLLTEYIEEKGICIERNTTLIDQRLNEQGVAASLRKSNGVDVQLNCKYIVGADGYESTVRNLLNIKWEGEQSRYPLFVTDCSLSEAHDQKDGQTLFNLKEAQEDIVFAISKKSIAGFFKLGGDEWRIDSVITQKDLHPDLSFKDATKDFSQRIAVNAKLKDPKWFSAFKTNTFIAGTFAKDRCFLIGDAAHVHTPIGAQGMNTGMQDAHNLAWKIAFVLKHACHQTLLDSYSLERRENALKLIQNTDRFFGYAIHQDWLTRTIRTRIFPLALQLLSPLTNSAALQRSFFKSVSQVDVKYKNRSNKRWTSFFKTKKPSPGEKWPFIPSTLYPEASMNLNASLSIFTYTLFVFLKDERADKNFMADVEEQFGTFEPMVKVKAICYSEKTRQLFKHLRIRKSCFFLIRPDEYIALREATQHLQSAGSYLKQMR